MIQCASRTVAECSWRTGAQNRRTCPASGSCRLRRIHCSGARSPGSPAAPSAGSRRRSCRRRGCSRSPVNTIVDPVGSKCSPPGSWIPYNNACPIVPQVQPNLDSPPAVYISATTQPRHAQRSEPHLLFLAFFFAFLCALANSAPLRQESGIRLFIALFVPCVRLLPRNGTEIPHHPCICTNTGTSSAAALRVMLVNLG